MQPTGANIASTEPEAATGELGLAPPASSLEACGSGLQVMSHGQCLWCKSAAVGTESVALAKRPKAALVPTVISSSGALVPFGPSRAELFKSTFDLSVL